MGLPLLQTVLRLLDVGTNVQVKRLCEGLPSSNTAYRYVRNLGFGVHYSHYVLNAGQLLIWLCGLRPWEARQAPQGTSKWILVRYILHLIKGEQNLLLLYSGRAQEMLWRVSPFNNSWGDFLTASQGSRAVRLRPQDEGSSCTMLCPICRIWAWPCLKKDNCWSTLKPEMHAGGCVLFELFFFLEIIACWEKHFVQNQRRGEEKKSKDNCWAPMRL